MKPKGKNWYYKDLFSHERHIAYLRSKSQCIFRVSVGLEIGGWELSLEDYFALWNTEKKWNNRGRQKDCYVLTRRDDTKPWSKDNCYVTKRLEILRKTNAKQRGIKRGPYKPRQK